MDKLERTSVEVKIRFLTMRARSKSTTTRRTFSVTQFLVDDVGEGLLFDVFVRVLNETIER